MKLHMLHTFAPTFLNAYLQEDKGLRVTSVIGPKR